MEPTDVTSRLSALGLRPDKGLGQHFLLDEAIAERSVSHAGLTRADTVLEIGPGLGILTRLLSDTAGRVVAVEKDGRLLGLVERDNVVYVHGDVLKVDLPAFDKVVSNLPYSISSPVTFRLLEGGEGFSVAVLMYQKEFAERLASGPGSRDYSRLSISAYVRARVEVLEAVPRTAFHPVPRVDSCIVRLTPREPPFTTASWRVFNRLVKVTFGQRRKKLRNSVRNNIGRLGLPPGARPDLTGLPYADDRPEMLTPEQFGEVADFLVEKGRPASEP